MKGSATASSSLKNIIYVGSAGFPFGMAQIQRQLYIARALSEGGSHVTVCSRKGAHQKLTTGGEQVQRKGTYEGVDYVYTSGSAYYNRNFLIRNFLKVVGLLGEFLLILRRRVSGKLDCLFANSISLVELRYYFWLSRFLRIELVYDYVEQIGELSSSSGVDESFDEVLTKYCDRVVYISQPLHHNVSRGRSDIKTLKIPPITDFGLFRNEDSDGDTTNPYFLFCGSADYHEVIKFIVDAFDQVEDARFELVLIVNGDDAAMSVARAHAKQSRKWEKIRIISDLSFDELVARYENASAMLIPLRDSVSDRARFPHKISEYLASGNPIVTSPVGEIENYFEDGKTALIASDLSVESFAEKLSLVCADPDKAHEIGCAGRRLGEQYFDYRVYSGKLEEFLNA